MRVAAIFTNQGVGLAPAIGLPLAIVLMCGVVGCAPSLTELDHDVARMMEQRQRDVLGQTQDNRPGQTVTADLRKPDEQAYANRPPTRNPSAADLPVATDTSTRTDPTDALPTVLPDADQATALDLQGVLRYALANARDYRSAKEALYSDTLDLIAERHLWGPRFFNTTSATATGTPEAGDNEQAATVINDFRVTQRLPYGGDVSVRALVNYVTLLRESSSTTDPDDQQTATVSTSINLPLLRGAGQTARESLIQSERDLIYAVRRFERFRRSFLVDVSTTYYNLVRNVQSIKNQERQVENFEWLERRINALADAGREPYFEVQRAEQQVLFARNRLLNARENYASALDAFKLRLGMPVEEPLLIEAVDVAIPTPRLEVTSAVRTALANRLDLQTQADRVGDQARAVAVARNNTLPDLDLTASVTLNTDDSKDRAGLDLDAGEGSYSAGVSFGAPLDRTRERTAVQQALINYERAKRDLDQQRDAITQDVRDSIREIEQSRFTLALQTRNIDVARKRLRGVLLRLRSLGPRDFIEAQDDLLNAENLRDSAERDLRVNTLLFLLSTGQMRVSRDGTWQAPAKLTPEPATEEESPSMDQLIQPEPDEAQVQPQEVTPPAPETP